MNILLSIALTALCFVVSSASNEWFTVTEEAWFEVEVKDLEGKGMDYRGRFTVALFGKTAPMTVLNIASIVRGYKRGNQSLSYKDTPVHRVVKDFVIQMGDITTKDGSGSTSIYGEQFNDEEFLLSHRAPGFVSMANRGKDTNGSQFFITMVKARWMDGKHVVFGKVIRGYDVLRTLNELEVDENTGIPKLKPIIVDCGLNRLDRNYELSEYQLDSTDDVD